MRDDAGSRLPMPPIQPPSSGGSGSAGESQDAFFKRMNSVMKSNAAGPLVVSLEIVKWAARWTSLPKIETGGVSASQMTKAHLGFRLHWFEKRASAVEVVGHKVVTWADAELCLRLARIPNDAKREEIISLLLSTDKRRAHQYAHLRQRLRQGLFLTNDQARDAIAEVLGKRRGLVLFGKCRECEQLRHRCDELRALLKKHGILEHA